MDFDNFIRAYLEHNDQTISIESGINMFLLHVKAHNTINTYRYYRSNLSYIEEYLLDHHVYYFNQITTEVLDDYVFYNRSKSLTNNTTNKRIGALKTVSVYLSKQNLIKPIEYNKLKIINKNIETIDNKTIEKLIMLINTFSNRDKLIVSLLLMTGIRRTELCYILKRNIDFKNNIIYLEKTKTNSPRNIFFTNEIKSLISDVFHSNDSMYLFGKDNNPLSPNSIDAVFRKIKKGLNNKVISPHKLRHTFATTLLRKGANLEQVRLLLGHSSYDMTKKYLHLVEDDLKKCSLNLNPFTINKTMDF